jgi:hypothetical protein
MKMRAFHGARLWSVAGVTALVFALTGLFSPSGAAESPSDAAALIFLLGVSRPNMPANLADVSKAGASPRAVGKAPKVDLNTATQRELETLSGIGPATAKRIIRNRPYASVAELSRASVAEPIIERIRPLVTVGAAPPSAAAPRAAAGRQMGSTSGNAGPKPSATEVRAAPAKGLVWVNTSRKVFYREGDRWYGRTRDGKFMTEEDAVKAGFRASKEGPTKE